MRLKTAVARVRQAVAWQLRLGGIPTGRSDFSGDQLPKDRDGAPKEQGAVASILKVKTMKDPRDRDPAPTSEQGLSLKPTVLEFSGTD